MPGCVVHHCHGFASACGPAVPTKHDRQRPASTARHHLADRHVDGINIRPFFAVHFDVDKRLIHQTGYTSIFERLMLHHVAPVAGGVADGQEDGLILDASRLESFVGPRPPGHRIVFMLKEVGALFVLKSIAHWITTGSEIQ